MNAQNNFGNGSGTMSKGGSRVGGHGGGVFLALLTTFICSGCATTYKGKIGQAALAGGIAGLAIGQIKDANKDSYSLYYGAVAALASGLVATYYYDPDHEITQFQQETSNLKRKLDEFQKPVQVDQGKNLYSAKLPSDVSKFIQPGEWKRYKMDQWVQDPNSPNIWYRQVEMFEVIPPITQ